MNILFISRNSPFESIGGVERYITNLINFFNSKADTQSHLFIMLPTTKDNYTEKNHNVTIYYDKNLFVFKSNISTKKEISKKVQEFSENVKQILITNSIDIICAENFHTDLPPAYSLLLNMLALSQKIPLILQLHSFATTELQTELINELKWEKISCVSKSVTGDCFQKGADINSLTTHYLGVNEEEFTSKKMEGENLKKRAQFISKY